MAKSYETLVFAHVFDAAVREHYHPVQAGKNTAVLLKQFDGRRADFEGSSFEEAVLKNFINANKLPLVSEFSQVTIFI